MSLRIAEIFASIQGEGRWLGTPSTFVRVSGCNLRCVWCDTPYASWKPEGPVMSLAAILECVERHRLKHIVITGGEPMLFDGFEPLCMALAELGHVLTVETAGTVFRDLPVDLMSISPKLANSTPPADSGWSERHESVRGDREPLQRLVERYDCQLKFVVQGPEDIPEVDQIIAALPAIRPDQIFLMPEGITSETLAQRARRLAPICLEREWRLGPRLQIELYGNTRGT